MSGNTPCPVIPPLTLTLSRAVLAMVDWRLYKTHTVGGIAIRVVYMQQAHDIRVEPDVDIIAYGKGLESASRAWPTFVRLEGRCT